MLERDFRELREGVAVEDVRDGVAHVHHDQAEAAVRLVGARAAFVGRHAGATDGRERAVNLPDDFADVDFGSRARERVAAVFPACAGEEAGVAELGEDLLQKSGGHLLRLGERAQRHERTIERLRHREIEQRAECVFAFFGELHLKLTGLLGIKRIWNQVRFFGW